MMTICHRAKTLDHFDEILEEIAWNGRQIPLDKWESIAVDLGFTPDNYYTPAGKMFSEKFHAKSESGRLQGTIVCITGIISR